LALLNEHLNCTERVMYMPRHLMVSTQGIMWPEAVVIIIAAFYRVSHKNDLYAVLPKFL